MNLVDKLKIRDTVHRLAEMLVAGDFDGIEEATRGRRLTAEQLRQLQMHMLQGLANIALLANGPKTMREI